MKSSTQVILLCFNAVFAFTLTNALPQTLFSSGGHINPSADVTDDDWSAHLSPDFSVAQFKAIQSGLFSSLNESVQDLKGAMRLNNFNKVQRHLKRMNENWRRIESAVSQLILTSDNLDSFEEESKLVVENRRIVNRQRELATEFLLKAAKSDISPDLIEVPKPVTSLLGFKVLNQIQDDVTSLYAAIDSGNEAKRQAITAKIQNELWPKFTDLSLKYFATINHLPIPPMQHVRVQNNARKMVAKALFKAGVRNCESPDDTLFDELCIPYGNVGAPCQDDNLQLYDGPDNVGICDCKAQDTSSGPYNGLIYSNVTGTCYVQNSQGPCADNEWVIVKNDQLVCEAVPEGCSSSDDGKNVYWSPDLSTPESCVELGSEQSCGILNRHGFELVCTPPLVSVGSESSGSEPQLAQSPLKPQPCSVGSYRQQNGLCQ